MFVCYLICVLKCGKSTSLIGGDVIMVDMFTSVLVICACIIGIVVVFDIILR